jgi:fatty-acyl-CoA synthase
VNIYPREIEDRLALHPLVADVGVIGLPHEEMGEIVTAFVEPTQWPIEDEQAFAKTLDGFARAALSPVKIPRRYVFRESLGRTETGKLLKKAMKDDFMREGYAFHSL